MNLFRMFRSKCRQLIEPIMKENNFTKKVIFKEDNLFCDMYYCGKFTALEFYFEIKDIYIDFKKSYLYRGKPPEEYAVKDNKLVRESIFSLLIRRGFRGGFRSKEPGLNEAKIDALYKNSDEKFFERYMEQELKQCLFMMENFKKDIFEDSLQALEAAAPPVRTGVPGFDFPE